MQTAWNLVFLYYFQVISKLTHFQHMQNSVAHAIVAAPKSSPLSSILVLSLAWSSGMQWTHWSTISTLPLPSVLQSLLSQLSTTSSQFSHLDPHDLHPWSPSFILHLSHVSKSQTVLFDTQHLSYGMNFSTLTMLHTSQTLPSSTCSNPDPVLNLSHGVFHSQLKTYLFLKSFLP